MKRVSRALRIIGTGLLVSIAAAFVFAIVELHDWGGRMEAILVVFGDRVWVTLDLGRPRVFLLLLIPAVLLLAAFSLRAWRSGQPGD